MIQEITLENFKSFGKEGTKIIFGPLTLIVGTNASGKSNIRDALRFLHGIGRGYNLADIIGARYGQGGERVWDGVRGGILEIIHQGAQADSFTLSVESSTEAWYRVRTGEALERRTRTLRFKYTVEIDIPQRTGRPIIRHESLSQFNTTIFSTYPNILRADQITDSRQILSRIRNPSGKKFLGPLLKLRRDQPLVSQLADHGDSTLTTRAACGWFLRSLDSIRFLDLDPQALRRPSISGQTTFGDKGENLSSVLQALCEEEDRKEALIEWIRELTPLDVVDLEFPRVSLEGRVQAVLVEEGGRKISAESASDGTLRFLAYVAALLGTNPASMYFFEEIENGIHPNRIHLLLNLMKRATSSQNVQVVATTHSPALLNFLRGDVLKAAVLVTRKGGCSHTSALRDLPMSPSDQSVAGELLESGWFENVEAFLAKGD